MKWPFFLLLVLHAIASIAQNKDMPSFTDSLLAVLPNQRNDSLKVKVLNSLSYEYRRINPDTGLLYAQQALSLAKQLGYRNGMAQAWRFGGINLYRLSDYPRAMEWHQNAATMFEQVRDRQGQAANFNNIGNVWLAQADYPKALDWYKKALAINERLDNPQELANNLNNIGNIYFNNSNYAEALTYYQRTQPIYEKLGSQQGEALCLGNIGAVYEQLGDYPRALDHYYKALKLYETLGDAAGQADNYFNLSSIFHVRQEYEKALEFNQRALEIWESLGDKAGQATNLNSMGITYNALSRSDKAIECHQQSLLIFESLDNLDGVAANLNNLGEIYEKRTEHDKALEYFNKSLAIYSQIGRTDGQAINLNRIGNILYKQSNIEGAIKQQQEALLLAQKTGDLSNENEIWQSLSFALEKKGDYIGAYDAFKKHIAIRDSILGEATKKQITRRELQYEFDKKETELRFQQQLTNEQLQKQTLLTKQRNQELRLRSQQLDLSNQEKELQRLAYLKERAEKQEKEQQLSLSEKEKELQASELTTLAQKAELQAASIKAQKQQRNWSFAGSGLLLLLMFFIYRNFSIQKKSNLLLGEANQKLAVKNDENELLLKEIHHRVKNNLQTISSLLNLQSASIQDAGALSAVQQSQGRVRSMALIHQKLYQGTNLAGVEMKDYLETMTEAVKESFGAKASQIKLLVDMPPLELDVDTAIPIGLIVNELLTNSLKHAFPDGRPGIIKVSLTEEAAQQYCLRVSDDGIGLPETASPGAFNHQGFGTRLVQLLSLQLNGKLSQASNNGLSTSLRF